MDILIKDTNTNLQLSDDIFSYSYNEGLVHQAVNTYLNNARTGNSAQKTRSEVRGGGRKPWAQKGTGRARAGTIRSPIWRSGGVTFASKKRSYVQKINKKMYKRAMRSILSELIRNDLLTVISDFNCENHKTKTFLQKMNQLEISNAMIVFSDVNENVYLASRNLTQYDVCNTESINPVSLLKHKHVLVTENAIKEIEEQLQ